MVRKGGVGRRRDESVVYVVQSVLLYLSLSLSLSTSPPLTIALEAISEGGTSALLFLSVTPRPHSGSIHTRRAYSTATYQSIFNNSTYTSSLPITKESFPHYRQRPSPLRALLGNDTTTRAHAGRFLWFEEVCFDVRRGAGSAPSSPTGFNPRGRERRN